MNNLKNIQAQIKELESQIQPIKNLIKDLQIELDQETIKIEKQVLEDNSEVVTKLNDAGAEDIFVDLNNSDDFTEVSEDDGTLHITFGKIRGFFICNQDISKSEWNKEAREIIKALGLKWSDLK